jgi:hypothetical protein
VIEESLSDRERERSAARVLVVHFIWFVFFLTAAFVSAAVFCGGNDDCYGMWIFVWGMPWLLGELFFAMPAIGATLYLLVRLRAAPGKAVFIGLGALIAIPLYAILAGSVLP